MNIFAYFLRFYLFLRLLTPLYKSDVNRLLSFVVFSQRFVKFNNFFIIKICDNLIFHTKSHHFMYERRKKKGTNIYCCVYDHTTMTINLELEGTKCFHYLLCCDVLDDALLVFIVLFFTFVLLYVRFLLN